MYRSGMGAMGRGQLEKMLLAEAVHLFHGDGCLSHDNEQNFERKLQPGAIAALENQLKTKLDRKQLDQETCINSEDYADNRLFNGVVHIYNRIILLHEDAPGLRGHGDSQTVFFFPPKTSPRHFHHQKVLCDDANIYICIALKIINTPVNRSSSLN